jgi:two-component system response regulator MprA/two-component system C4-dicarboxylate transport response regulator DctD
MLAPRQILLADDDSSVRCGVADLLSDLGIESLHAETGREALEIVRSKPIHACLLDLQMPECGGLEALPLIRRARADLPCLVYSGSLTEFLEREALRIGAFAVLRKPVQPHVLRQQICRALGLPPPPACGALV